MRQVVKNAYWFTVETMRASDNSITTAPSLCSLCSFAHSFRPHVVVERRERTGFGVQFFMDRMRRRRSGWFRETTHHTNMSWFG